MTGWPRVRAASVVRLLAVAALCSVTTSVAAAAQTTVPSSQAPGRADQSLAVPVDRQFYVTALTQKNPLDGSTVDAYNADPSSIHVAINGGAEFARSFIHVALDYLPQGARIDQVTLTLHLTAQSDASTSGVYPLYNVNQSQAIVEACALTSPLTSSFDAAHPPGVDCEHGSAVGRPNAAGDTWTFALKDLVGYWRQHGNTGAALLPVGTGDPSQTWAVAFYKSRSSSIATYLAPPIPVTGPGTRPPGASHQPPAGSGVAPQPAGGAVAPAAGSAPGSVTGVTPSAPGPAPAVATVPSTGSGPHRASAGSHGATHYWPLVLVGCLVLAAVALGAAHRAQIAALARRIGPPTASAFRAHPRAYTVATVAVVWGLVFSGYSLEQPTAAHSQAPVASTAPQSASTGTAPSPTSPGDASAPAATGQAHPVAIGPTGTSTAPSTGNAAGGSVPGARTTPRNELSGPGTYRVIDGVRVFFPANGGPPVADLYHGADDTIGLTPDTIRVCAHAALTYGSAFHISASDLDVYWKWLNDHGGIYGRKVVTHYTNDNYDPGTAVQAAQSCKDWGTFMLLGGIGFDQIPAVRQWAEQNHMLYLHHVATTENTAGLRYSFSALPSVEELGRQMGQLAAWKFSGKKVGIIYRNSSNWSPGVTTFEQVVKAAGMQIVGSYPVTINQGNYTQEVAQLHAKGAQLVFAWENALSSIEILKQAQAQNYHPAWLVAAFNIITNTLGSSALDQDMWGATAWDAYDPGYYGGGFASYAADIKEFEAEYKHYDPGASLGGDGGDLLFDTWESWRFLADLFKTCGPDCTRNKMAGLLLAGYHKTVPPNCPVDFRRGDHHHGGYLFDVLHAVRDPNGRANWVPVERCVPSVGSGA